ncbi:helix-turn-helix transcriptional regulator [Psychrosphaera algicola]|uniref:Helix-turn-helix transcriptional regulator n=1 Tax=Psychrosphaera algicola TaxID=3023714 RepID=A0ABT5FGE8_9GAMM|nr:helix-turn-helix transcriptional regulator [Psychrosphaera sp. G1-22]MDC2890068.1 helix-turn-helix transcriptional regulator [Psychrosphaera sp. G1-22]
MNINAELIKIHRTKHNWTQQVLAESCGVSLRTIQRVERYGNASHETVMALASVFEIEQSEIVIPESPVVELEMKNTEGSKLVEQAIQFVITLITGMLIGAALMRFLN